MNTNKLVFLGDNSLYKNKPNIINNSLYIPYPCESYHTCSPFAINFPAGTYIVHLYGASGGDANFDNTIVLGGKGGYVTALLSFSKATKAFLYIGGRGTDRSGSTTKGGYNKGGHGIMNRGSGGGATDIRLTKDDLYSRIIVAGAGGGAFSNPDYYNVHQNGGDGGGLKGMPGGYSSDVGPCVGSQDGCVDGLISDPGSFGAGSKSAFGSGGAGWWSNQGSHGSRWLQGFCQDSSLY